MLKALESCRERLKAGSQNDARPCVALRRHALTLAATQPNARIDSNPIPAFPRVAFERQIEKNCANSIVSPLAKFNATQRKAFASTCEPAFNLSDLTVKANLSDNQVHDCCKRLLLLLVNQNLEQRRSSCSEQSRDSSASMADDSLTFDLTGLRLRLSDTYSVSSDGELRIPWNFIIK